MLLFMTKYVGLGGGVVKFRKAKCIAFGALVLNNEHLRQTKTIVYQIDEDKMLFYSTILPAILALRYHRYDILALSILASARP